MKIALGVVAFFEAKRSRKRIVENKLWILSRHVDSEMQFQQPNDWKAGR